jgi:hypothetical protein
MSIQFRETGKDLESAMKNLTDRRDAAKAQLMKLGAKENSFRSTDVKLAAEDPRTAMMMNVGRQAGKKKKKATASKVTIVTSTSCEWALPQGSADELLTFVQTTKDKVQTADLAGQKEQKKLSAEEQEEAEEMEILQQQFGNSAATKPGEPRFVFLAKISAEEQQKARTAAYKKAHVRADHLANAAGKKLGKLHSLTSSGDESTAMQMMAYRRYQMGDGDESEEESSDDGEEEGVGMSPSCTSVKFTYSVHAAFELVD